MSLLHEPSKVGLVDIAYVARSILYPLSTMRKCGYIPCRRTLHIIHKDSFSAVLKRTKLPMSPAR
jgi:hypothetical protein